MGLKYYLDFLLVKWKRKGGVRCCTHTAHSLIKRKGGKVKGGKKCKTDQSALRREREIW